MNKHRIESTRARRMLPCAVLASAFLCAAAAPQDVLDSARESVSKWVETQQLISQETSEWRDQRALLEARIDVVRRDIEETRARIAESEERAQETAAKVEELQSENDGLEQDSTGLADALARLEAKTAALTQRFPAPLTERIRPLVQRLPVETAQDAAEVDSESSDAGSQPIEQVEQSLSERYLCVLGILDAADRFQSEITVRPEVRALADGTSMQVTAYYLGLGQSYYAGAGGGLAGIGTLGDEGWEWVADNESAAAIHAGLRVAEGEVAPMFTPLPFRLR